MAKDLPSIKDAASMLVASRFLLQRGWTGWTGAMGLPSCHMLMRPIPSNFLESWSDKVVAHILYFKKRARNSTDVR